MGLFGSAKVDGKELQECLAYFEAETKVISFQTKEADVFNNAMLKYGNSIMENPGAAEEMKKAATRLSQTATEILIRHEHIKDIPVAALEMHYAWHTTFLANAAWASAMLAAIQSNKFAPSATAKDMNLQTKHAQQLGEELQKARRKANDEEKKFLKQLKVSAEDVAKIVARAT